MKVVNSSVWGGEVKAINFGWWQEGVRVFGGVAWWGWRRDTGVGLASILICYCSKTRTKS